MAVSNQQVRDLLDGPAATSVLDTTITANINRSTAIVNKVKDSSSIVANVDHAITAVAVWLTYGSYMEGISMQLGAISIADQVKLDHLRKVAELFINQIATTFVDLDPDNQKANMQGINPEVFTMTVTEAFKQDTC